MLLLLLPAAFFLVVLLQKRTPDPFGNFFCAFVECLALSGRRAFNPNSVARNGWATVAARSCLS
jgi:hypothetical protein